MTPTRYLYASWPTGFPPKPQQDRIPMPYINRQQAEFGIAIHVDPTKVFTTVILTGARYTGLGTAKLNPRDTYNKQTGVDVAMSRALRELADKLEAGA